jgi:pimeloyl-ACP methyl ester carboxylesterase
MIRIFSLGLIVWFASLAGCSDDGTKIMTTKEGVEFVRTPDSCFDSLPDWPYTPKYVGLDGLRQAYVDEGPADGEVVLLLHGQPSWSYLYRKMIPVLADAGFRVIAMDHLGMGRSDKPIDIASYSYLGHNKRLLRFIEVLDLRDINLFVQDWGSLIGLRVAGLNPDRFARIAVGDGMLPVWPEGLLPFPPVENPNETEVIAPLFAGMPAQQVPFYDGCEPLGGPDEGYFGDWMTYAMKAESFHASEVVEAMTWFDLPPDEEAAYDAPFPGRIYMAGPRTFPSLVNDVPGTTEEAWAGLIASDRPFLAIWASNDPGNLGSCEVQQHLVDSIPGAAGQSHDRLAEASHFLQDDQGEEIARRLVEFYSDRSDRTDESLRGMRYCEILLGFLIDGEIRAEVWGTQGLNLCPAEKWQALDPESIQAEYGADFIEMNGPRYTMMDAGSIDLPDGERRTYGDLEMQRLATLVLNPSQVSADPYTEARVERTTVFEFWSGFQVFQLTSPEGAVYVMQSMSQMVDPDLALADLPGLGSRLELPDGWTYQVNRRITDLVQAVESEVFVLQDDLKNTYMRVGSNSTGQTLPVLDDGTGTPCSSDADCQSLDASHCLLASGLGYCTVEGCAGGECGAPYVCCYDCSEVALPMLPFNGSACIPEAGTGMLTAQAGCTCD